MEIRIRYRNVEFPLNIPDTARCDEYRGREIDDSTTAGSFIEDIAKTETGLFGVKDADLFIVNDAYRPTPTSLILDWLSQNGRLNDNARFIVATGTHAAPSEEQLGRIFGNHLNGIRDRILIHDCKNKASMIEIGRDYDDSPIMLNRIAAEAARIVVIGSVEPHFFAGFTGGRKSIFPGVCDYDTIVRNHNRAVSLDAMPMKLKGNPIEEHLEELMARVQGDKIFGIQVVSKVDSDKMRVFVGSLTDAFRAAIKTAESVYGITVRQKYDLLLAEIMPPLDSNLYQLQKSLENCQRAVADGGTILLFSSCHEGIGSTKFYKLADKWKPGMHLEGEEAFGSHKLVRVYDIGKRINVCLFSELPDEIPEKVFFNPVRSPQGLLDSYFHGNEQATIGLVRDASHTVLINAQE